MKKFTLFLMSLFLTLGTALAQNYTPTEERLSSDELNAKTASTLVAIKNLSATNHAYFVGNTGAAPYSVADFSDAAVFVWQPVNEGEAGSYYLMKLDGTYMQATSPKDFGTIDGAAVFTTTNPTVANGGFNGDGDSQAYVDDQAMLVRFVNASGSWINVQNGNSGTPVYNQGKGGWTIHYVYTIEEATVEPDPGPTPEPDPTPEPEAIPAANKLYTVVAEGHNSGTNPQWAINDEGTSIVSSGNTNISTDEQKQFAFVTFNEATYIYSPAVKKFVMKDASLSAKNGDAVEIVALENGKFFFRFDASHNINIGGSKQMIIDGWSTVDGGNQFTLIEAGEFDPAEALAALNSTVEVVYVYMYNGVEVGRLTVKDEVGNAYPAVANVPFGFTANTPEGVIEGAGEVVIECTLIENYPIKYAASVEEIDTWYYMQMHSNNKKYIQYLADQSYLEWADAEVAEGEEDSYTWAFVGDPANGFKLVNYAAGKELAVCSDGSSDPVLGAFADAVVWKPASSKESGNDAYFCLQFPGSNNYMNAQSGKVAYWSDNDAGSTFLLTEREITLEPEPELAALEVVSADRNPLETAWEGKYKLQGVKLNFNEVVKRYNTASYDGDYGYILDAEGNEVAKLDKCMGGNGTMNTFATPYSSTGVAVAGTYKVVVKSGVIFSADGTKEYKGGEFEFTVAQHDPVVTPSAEDGLCYNESFTKVDDFREFTITVQYATEVVINAEKKVELKYIKKEGYQTVGEEVVAEATVTLADVDATTKEIKITFPEQEYAEGSYSFDIPAALFTVNGVANEVYVSNTFTYKKPQLKITRDFDSWESYLDSKWYMPTAAMITIANAETVEIDETKVATIAVGESVYNSTLSYYYDDWSNAYYIELIFEDFLAEGFEFVKGDYTFTLPAGFYTVNGIANEEAVKTYTYGDPIVEEFSVTEILPAPGSVLESLDAISITFSNGAQPEILPITCGEKTYYFIYQYGLYVAVDLMSYEPIVITEPGTYTLDLSELEGLTGEKVFSWTIAEAVEPEPTPGEVDYTPTNTGAKTRTGRNITSVSLGENTYSLLTPEQSSCYVDATETVTFTVEAGATVKATVAYQGEWMHHAVYIDFDGDGFTSGIEEGSEWKPAGDLVAYSFYNNNGSSDEYGYNSVGTYMSGMDRHVPEIPEFAVPTTPGTYRIRFVQDWCSIDPLGDADGKFGDFMANGGQIVDVMLEVTEPTGIENVENAEVKAIYDLTGRKIETITKSGIYIVNGKKVLVK